MQINFPMMGGNIMSMPTLMQMMNMCSNPQQDSDSSSDEDFEDVEHLCLNQFPFRKPFAIFTNGDITTNFVKMENPTMLLQKIKEKAATFQTDPKARRVFFFDDPSKDLTNQNLQDIVDLTETVSVIRFWTDSLNEFHVSHIQKACKPEEKK